MHLTNWRDFLKFLGSASLVGRRRSRTRVDERSTSVEPLEVRVLPAANVLSIEATNPPLAGAVDASSITYTVTFDRDVVVGGVDASDFRVVTSGTVQFNPTISVTSIDHSTYTVTIQGVRGTGDLRLDLIDNDTILDEAEVQNPQGEVDPPLGGAGLYNGSFQGDTYHLAAEHPKVVSINRIVPPEDVPYATTIRYQVQFSEPVAGVDATDFDLALTGGVAVANAIQVAGSGALYTVTISGISGNGSIGLNLVDDRSIRDAFGNALVPSGTGPSFAEPVTIDVGGNARSLAAADMNGDGLTDLVASLVSGNVIVQLGNGNGTFQTPLFYSVSGSPGAIAVRDMNGDGNLDVVVINGSGNTIEIYAGNGDGTLQSPDSLSTGIDQWALALEVTDSDGKPDILVINAADNRADILVNSGNNVFVPVLPLATGNTPSDIVLGDVNGDGDLDVVISNLDDNTVKVYLSLGGDGYGSPQTYPVGNVPNTVALGDVDGDGDLDLVTSNEGSNNLSLLRGNGDGTFQTQVTYPTGSMPTAVRMIDINGDGLCDIIYSNFGISSMGIMLGKGDGTLLAELTYPASPVPGNLAIGDFNRDGRLDVLIAESELSGVYLLNNTSIGSFTGQVYERSNATPSITTPSEIMVPENLSITADVAIIAAIDTDTPPQALSYSISGDDTGSFTYDPTTGALHFKFAPDYENPVDANTDNTYEITVTADDGFGGVSQRQIMVMVQPVNDNLPVFTFNNEYSVPENSSDQDPLFIVNATDADLPGDLISYSISGVDVDQFVYNSESREIFFKNSPDYENPTDADGDNVYTLVITADDNEGGVQTQTVQITVTPLNDNYPIFDEQNNTVSVPENTPTSSVIFTVNVTDADLPGDTLRFSLEGADAAQFAIDELTGEIRFVNSPDYEIPTDSDHDNDYEITVVVSDYPESTSSANFTITVTAVNDNSPLITPIDPVSVFEHTPASTVVLNVDATDADLPLQALTYGLSGTDAEQFSINSETGEVRFLLTPNYDTPTDQDHDNIYHVVVTASDGNGAITTLPVTITVLPINDFSPVISSSPTASIPENTPASSVVLDVDATDADTPVQTLNYSISGVDAELFSIDPSNGQIRFRTSPDYETPADFGGNNEYLLTVTVSDGNGGSQSRELAITVLPVNDNIPSLTSGDAASFDENSATSTVVLDVNATDADQPLQTFIYGLSGVDAELFTIGSDGEIRFRTSPNFEVPDDSDQDGVYLIRVTVADSGDPALSTTQDLTITVNNVNEAPAAGDLTLETDSETPLSIELNGSDPDAGTILSYSIETEPLHGTLSAVDGQPGNFVYTPDPGYVGPDSFTYRAHDDSFDSNLATVSITVNLGNSPPVVEDATVSIAENSPNGTLVTTVLATDEDIFDGPDSDAITFAITGGNTEGAFSIDPSNGELRVSNVAALNFEVRQQIVLQVTVTDLLQQSSVATITVNITNVNEPLIIGLPSQNFLTYRTNGAPVPIDPQATVFDEDLTRTDYHGGRLTISVSMTDPNQPNDPHDRLGLPVEGSGPGRLSIVSNYIVYDSPLNIIGTIVSGLDGGPLIIDLTTFSDDLTTVPALLRAITFYNTSSNPLPGTRTITFELVDGPGENSGVKSKQLNFVTESADPVIVPGHAVEVPRGSAPVLLASDATVTDVDSVTLKGGRLTVTAGAGANASDRLRILRTGGIKISGKNVLFNGNKIGRLTATRNSITVDFNTDAATPLAAQQLLRSLAFSTTSKFSGVGPRTYNITVTDGAGGQFTTTQAISVIDRAQRSSR